ncbi:MAG: hypothetical protein SFX73_40140 [Kofleriaceae bacterium]|nr:hypothetical protein [Kofleriaceae bacterium]
MSSLRSVWVVGAVSCAPVSTSVRKSEQVSARRDERGAVVRTNREAVITTKGELAVTFTERDLCRVQAVEEFRRSERTTKSVSKGVLALDYIAGITLGVAGGFALAAPDDAASAVEPIKPLDRTQVGRDGFHERRHRDVRADCERRRHRGRSRWSAPRAVCSARSA